MQYTGIQGGFAPPTPDAIYTINKLSTNTYLLIQGNVRQGGSPNLEEIAPKSLESSQTDTEDLVNELHDILKTLPTELPQGSEDIYALNTSIAWGSEDFAWNNGGPEGCGGGTSSVQPTPEEKSKFERAVEIVDALVKKAA
jgi:hypothetical protein